MILPLFKNSQVHLSNGRILIIAGAVCAKKCRKILKIDVVNRNVPCQKRFVNMCIDKENLQTAIRNLSDTYVFTPRYASKSMRHAAYRLYVMWKHRHVVARRRVVIPSCCVCAIGNAYPSPRNQYTGFVNGGVHVIRDE